MTPLSLARSTLFLLLLVTLGQGIRARSLDEIKRSGKIYVALTPDDRKNINYELAKEFARYLNVEMIEVEISWEEAFMKDGMIPENLETDPELVYTPDALKKADIICSTFTIIEWRKRLFGFAETLQSAELLLVHADTRLSSGWRSFTGKKIAFRKATTFERNLKEINATTGAGMELVGTGSSEETKRLIEQDQVSGIVLDADEALNFIAETGQKYRIAFPISDVSRVAWAVDKNNPLIEEVENFFETIASNGILDEFFYDRFGITYSAFLDHLDRNLRPEIYMRDLDAILESGKLVVALRERSFIYKEGGQKQFMHALAEEFADYLGVDLEFVVTPYFSKYWETREGTVFRDSSYTPDWFRYFDLACEVIAPLEWRTNKVEMIPVYPSAYTVVARKETSIGSLQDLEELTGVTGRETVYEDILVQNGIGNYYYERVNNFLTDVAAGKADYTIIYNAFYELSAYPGLESKLELGNLDVCWALRKDQPRLAEALREFIKRSRNNGLIGLLLKALRGNTLQAPEAFIHSYYESFQTGELPYVSYGADDGLPQEDVFSIFQDRKGYIWFGTNSGAVRYNGRDMDVFNHDQGLPGNSVRDIQQDSSGILYFATTNGVACFRKDTTVKILMEGTSVHRIFIDSKNRIWFLGDDGLYLEEATGRLTHMNSLYPELPAVIHQMTEDDATGQLFLGTSLGVFLLDPEAGKAVQLSDGDSYSLYIDANDSIWVSTREGLFISGVEDLVERRLQATAVNLNRRYRIPVSIVSSITTNRFGSIWLVTDSKILQVLSSDQDPIIYEQEIGIKNNKILSFLVDREDNIWIGFSGGLQRLTSRRGLRNFYPGTLNSYIYSVFSDRQERIWIASDNGIFYFQDDQLVNFTPRTGSGSSKFCGALLPSGNILLASNEGLYEVNSRSLEVIRTTRFGKIAFSPESLFVTAEGEIFLLTGINGVIYYFRDFSSSPLELKSKFTSNIFQLVKWNGRIIGGNSTGFVTFDGERFVPLEKTSCNIWSLCREENRIWVGTDCGIGLVKEGRFAQMDLTRFDRDLVIKTILPARNRNYLWLGTNQGFSYFNTQTRGIEFTVDTKDGLTGDEITPGGLYLDRNDLLWVGTYHGLSNFNIRAKSTATYAPVCYIESLYLNGREIEAENGRVFGHDENNLVFEISALSFSDEASVEYEYYLRGTGHNYSSYHRGREYRANYNNLPPGDYEFIYKAKGKNNIWGYAERFDFTIRKAWYNTWLFRVSVLLLFLVSVYLIYRIRIHTIKAQRNRLEEQVRHRTHELEVANTEIEAQRDFARYQRDQIAQQQKAIMDSIHYAQTIQNSLLPGPDVLNRLLPSHFILYKPRDIVSGDFYWVHESNGHIYLSAADCTGHGVPGAFMSMLGMALLNDIVGKQPDIRPDQLLNRLRNMIIDTLHQQGEESTAKDGMDMVVCRLHPGTLKLEFAGANNPLYLVRDSVLTEYRTDRMPVSIHPVMEPFTPEEIFLQKGDCVYLLSDGFADQFGGTAGKKFKYRRLKEILAGMGAVPMEKQRQLLEEEFNSWKGRESQVDDVVILGMKF